MQVRRAQAGDLPIIVAIYNGHVADGVATFDTEPWTVEGKRAWFEAFGETSPCFVAEVDGTVVGYAYYAPFRARPAYAATMETSVYVAPDAQGRGAGKGLYAALIDHARARGVHTLLGVVAAGNPASEALHRHFAFELRGRLREVGFKHGRYIDTLYYQKLLDP